MKQLLKDNIDYVNNIEIIRRDYYYNLLEELVSKKGIFVLVGQRRVGKSYVVLDYLKNKKKYFYFNKELDDKNKIKTNVELSMLFDIYKEEYGEPEYVVIDEIQDIEGWETFVRKLFTHKKYKIIITGCNSKLLSGELATYLTGRYIQVEIFPLCFDEYKKFSIQTKKNLSDKQLFLEYVEFGGLPEVFFVELKHKFSYTKFIKDSIILKDIVDRYGVKNVSVLEKIFKYLGDVLGSLVSTSNITNYFKANYNKTLSTSIISKYLDYCKTTFLINGIPRYDIEGKKILEYVGKYYFSDIGIRNTFGYNFTNDIGKILENIVYLSLRMRGWTVYFGASKDKDADYLRKRGWGIYVGTSKNKEVSFIAKKDNKTIYIQVSYMIDREKMGEVFGNLIDIKDNWPKYVISMDEKNSDTYKGINHLNILDMDQIFDND